jgi:transcriptional regulator with PAS, ATPase and Fis domain/tetratricopeptide (TPR) repeat protein
MAPDTCRAALSTTIDGDHAGFLTEYADVLSPSTLGDEELEPLFGMLFKTLAIFENYDFHCGDLFAEAIGRTESGDFVLLPNAYILPFFYDEAIVGTSVVLRQEAGAALVNRRFDVNAGLVHTQLLGKLITQLTSGDRLTPARKKLRATATAISNGTITTLASAHDSILARPLAARRQILTMRDAHRIEAEVDEVVDRAAEDGSVVLVTGESYAGKSDILKKAAALLDRSESYNVIPLDEWDLFARSRKGAVRPKTAGHPVWMIDDIDEKTIHCSDFSASMLDSASFPKGSVIMSVHSGNMGADLKHFLDQVQRSRGDHYHEIAVEHEKDSEAARLAEYLRNALSQIGRQRGHAKAAPATPAGRPPKKLVKTFLSGLDAEERQLLEFLSVARFAMPLDLVLTVFSDSGDVICPAILRLAALDAVELFYRRLPQKNVLSLFLRTGSTALRRLIYEAIPAQRRKKLHRTVALLGEQQDTFPRYLLLFHCLESGQADLAARHAVAFLRETSGEERHAVLVSQCLEFWERGLLDGLDFADRIVANHELAKDLITNGRGVEAEKLLVDARDLIDDAEDDQRLKEASRISSMLRLLADRWEQRGEYKRSLDLLDDVREDFQAALSIADQAQLLNDLGWLQYRLADYDGSMESCRLSLNTLNAQQYPLIVAQALNLMGVVHFNTSRYDEAISYYEQSAYLRERSGDENLLAASYNNLALAYQSKGEFEKAFEHHNKSLKLKKRQNNRAGIAAGYLNVALLHLESRNFKEAETKCRESITICEEIGNAQLAADNYITLGDIALEGGDYKAAEHHYKESQRISHAREAINEEMGALRRLSSLYIKQERFAEARKHAEAAYALVQRIGSRYEDAQIEVILGDLELEQGRHVEALEHYERAANQYSALSKYRLGATVLSKIGLIHADNGNNFEARHHYDRAQDFVRADIGRELPEEFVRLQKTLREHPARSLVAGQESQKLLMAFYDLSALTDYAIDGHEFLQKIMDVVHRIADPVDSYLGLKAGDRYAILDGAGGRSLNPPKNIAQVFDRALIFGGLLDSNSPDAAEVARQLQTPVDQAFIAIPLKAMGEDLGCLLFLLERERLPLSNEDVNFFTWLGRQIAGNLKLMLHLNENFLKDEIGTSGEPKNDVHHQDKHRFQDLIGKSETMKRIFRTLEKVRETDSGILVLGESGTGKSALAGAIHYNSPRAPRPFQEIHCAQIPHNLLESELFGHERGSFTGAVQRKLGLCEMADGGTLFLDDINVMPVETQTKLLHFIENKTFIRLGGTRRMKSDVRIIAASNENLETLCREGKFREDLYYRLKVILIDLPPLRDRKEDMIAIALQYLKKSCSAKGVPLKTLSPEVVKLFQRAPWRGNVRELQNVLERVVVLSDENVITTSSLPDDFLKEIMGTSRQSHERLDELIDEIIKLGSYSEAHPLLPALEAMIARRMVNHVEGKNKAAALLGISKPTLYARLRDYDKMN